MGLIELIELYLTASDDVKAMIENLLEEPQQQTEPGE